jgi:hypothetical protein
MVIVSGTEVDLCSLNRQCQSMEWRVGQKITDRFLKIGNNVVAVLFLLETSEGHGRARNVLSAPYGSARQRHLRRKVRPYLFWVCKVLKERVLAPDDSLLLIRIGVLKTCCLASVPTEQTCHVMNVSTDKSPK